MKQDIVSRGDVELLINTFYDKVRKDEVIGFIFNEIIGDDWSRHLPQMYKFWDMVLLGHPGYEGHPTWTHLAADKKIPFGAAHFDRWLKLWKETTESLFEGEVATQAIEKAKIMAEMIHSRIEASRGGNVIQ